MRSRFQTSHVCHNSTNAHLAWNHQSPVAPHQNKEMKQTSAKCPNLWRWGDHSTELCSPLFQAGMSETHTSNNGTPSLACEISGSSQEGNICQQVAVYWNIPARRDWSSVHSCVSSMNIHEVSIRAFKVPEGP